MYKKHHNEYYNKELKIIARKFRKDATHTERIVWNKLLRRRRMKGYKFLRQRPILSYVVDFMCKELKLVIEIDGYSHQFKYEEDQLRNRQLSEFGFSVLRFTDRQVVYDLGNVQRVVETEIERIENP